MCLLFHSYLQLCILLKLVKQRALQNFVLLDCQQTTDHLVRFGAQEVARGEFMQLLEGGGVVMGVEQELGAF